jgi:hypothetical protein
LCEHKDNHPIYVSVLLIEYNSNEKILEISCKIFTNDFESVLRTKTKNKLDLINPADKNLADKLVSDYIKQHVKIMVEGNPVELKFLGYEQADESIESYFETAKINSAKKIVVQDDILYEYQSEQMSIIHTTVNNERKSIRLNNPDNKAVFEF